MNFPGNPNCDGSRCQRLFNDPPSEVRVLPMGGGANLILCRVCFDAEILWRKCEICSGREFDLPSWDELEVYHAQY